MGFPNVGKSTIISRVSAAKPKIADYHFTTLVPNLGVVELEDGISFVIADIPGLIEGAHTGAGLGHDFLRHTERTKLILHVLDISGSEERDPIEDFKIIQEELRLYRTRLDERPVLIVANKMDLSGAEENLKRLRSELGSNSNISGFCGHWGRLARIAAGYLVSCRISLFPNGVASSGTSPESSEGRGRFTLRGK